MTHPTVINAVDCREGHFADWKDTGATEAGLGVFVESVCDCRWDHDSINDIPIYGVDKIYIKVPSETNWPKIWRRAIEANCTHKSSPSHRILERDARTEQCR